MELRVEIFSWDSVPEGLSVGAKWKTYLKDARERNKETFHNALKMFNIQYFRRTARTYKFKFSQETLHVMGFLQAQNGGLISRVTEGLEKKNHLKGLIMQYNASETYIPWISRPSFYITEERRGWGCSGRGGDTY